MKKKGLIAIGFIISVIVVLFIVVSQVGSQKPVTITVNWGNVSVTKADNDGITEETSIYNPGSDVICINGITFASQDLNMSANDGFSTYEFDYENALKIEKMFLLPFGWRLPTKEEAEIITGLSCPELINQLGIDMEGYSVEYWTSTQRDSLSWDDFGMKEPSNGYKLASAYYVRIYNPKMLDDDSHIIASFYSDVATLSATSISQAMRIRPVRVE